jgi:hypothetical protein
VADGTGGEAGPAVTVLVDAEDDAAVTAALLDAHDPAAGCVVVHPTPAVSSSSALARDVLLALGRPVGQLADERISTAGAAFKAAAAWMIADGVRCLIVLRAHLLSPGGWEQLIEAARCAGVRLVLVRHGLDSRPELDQLLDGVEHHITKDAGEVLPVRAAPPRPLPGGAPAAELPRIPASDVHRFRADAWRCLPAADFARVDAVYGRGVEATCRWLSQHPDQAPQSGFATTRGLRAVFPPFLAPDEITAGLAVLNSQLTGEALRAIAEGLLCVGREWSARGGLHRWSDVEGLHRFLTELVADSPSRRHTITRLRGAQAGFLHHGLHLALPADLHGAHGPGLTTLPFTEVTAARLRAGVAHPVHAAAMATAMFTALAPDVLATIPISLLAEDAAVLRVPADRSGTLPRIPASYFVPAPARPLLLAARTFLYLRGASPSQRLLSAGVGHGAKMLTATADKCGLALPTRTPRTGPPWHTSAACWRVAAPLHAQDGSPP